MSTNRVTGKLLTAAAVAALAAGSLTACGSPSGSSSSGESKEASSMYTWITNENDRAQWQAFVDAAKKKDPAFSLTLEGPSFNDYWTKVKTRLSSSGAPCIITTQAARAQELKDLTVPLDDMVKSNNIDASMYNKAMIDGLTVDGSLRGIPYDAEPVVLYYNKDLLAAAGVKEPTTKYTTSQFAADLKALTKDGVMGLALPPGFGSGPGLPMAFANGNEPVKDGKLDLTDQGLVNDQQFAFDLVAKEKVANAPQASDGTDVPEQQFMSGKAAMIIDGPWMYDTLTTKTKGKVGIAVIPSTSGESIGMIQGSAFAIAASCKDKEAAFKNIMKITTPEVIGAVGAARGTVPSVESALKDWAGTKPAADVAVVQALLKSGRPLVTTPSWNQVETNFTQYSGEGFRGSKTAQDLLSTIMNSAK
ncbi:sugar ABC transporter substrate-binding protein [Pseudarthrobacter sp. BRE9]|uniref:ABC transporter substrate-binding protein n=1 Tax=Pseudarthrobacter sp. BRE9 TaxID=2962582 RepID=UPI0028819989|nr:sugar ABC transporter substrate-binding protein [Pseudarthrobacter sp. BRE9]MDT0170473.1 sugar ABC transporter substrate-binding protein [Pseudarthrobacter sp. BRE9]